MFDDIWLIGTCFVEPGDKRSYKFFWANNRRDQGRNLRRLAALIDAHPDVPVVTWSGTSAELPLLDRVTQRHRLGSLFDQVLARVEKRGDLFGPVEEMKQKLPKKWQM